MSRDFAVFNLRISPELRQAIDIAAKASGRSVNAEIAYRLTESINASRDAAVEHPSDDDGPAGATDSEQLAGCDVTDQESALLEMFRRLSHAKQLAVLSLLTAD